MRVLLLADDCNPEWPSLPVVGYKASLAIAEVADVVLVTQIRNQEGIEKHGAGRATVEYIDTEYIAAPLYKLGTWIRGGNQAGWSLATAMNYPAAIAFDREVWRRFRNDLHDGKFDIVHRLTPMSPALPSPIASWTPTPFVLGPLNGGLEWPREYRSEFRREKEYARKLRSLYKHLPYYKSTLSSASAILASFQHTIADLPDWVSGKVVGFPEIGLDPELFQADNKRAPGRQLTILSVGRFVPLKLLDVVLRTFGGSPILRRQKLVLVGDGMERRALEQLASDLGVSERVEFTGWRTQAEVGEYMRQADVFFFPSIRELGGGVVVEAMAAGCVPVVVDYGGPGEIVMENCGSRAPLGSREFLVRHFTQILERYVENRTILEEHRKSARSLALSSYTWRAKASRTLAVYEWALTRKGKKPSFFV